MDQRQGKREYDPEIGTDVPASEENFSLEEILAEYGGGRQKLLREVEELVARQTAPEAPPRPQEPDEIGTPLFHRQESPAEGPPAPPAEEVSPPAPNGQEAPAAPALGDIPDPEVREEDLDLNQLFQEELPKAPHPISLEEVVSDTVDAVMEEEAAREPLLEEPRRWLFSRRKMEDTESLCPEEEEEEEPLTEEETIGEEEDLLEASEEARRVYRRRQRPLFAALLTALLPCGLASAEAYGLQIPLWSEDPVFRTLALLACLITVCALTWRVFSHALQTVRNKQCTSEVLIAVSAVVAAADCLSCLLLPGRSPAAPYAAVPCLALVLAQWGITRESRGTWDAFRTAALDDEPPYLVTETAQGACKQVGAIRGFYTTALRENVALGWQTALLPVVLAGSLVFAFLSSVGQGRGGDFWLNWSAILSAGASFALPLCWGFPWSRLSAHLQKAGCTVAGFFGAEKISSSRSMILADADLFPPGTIQLNGVKVFGEELPKAVGYAATLARCSGSGLHRLFDGLLRSECGHYEQVDDFSFYEEGGYSATIRGESVLLGTASFLRKMEVRLPAGINLKTGIFLAVDHQVTAVFAVKYNASENVDFALRMMRRSHITPILASRDPNITPALLKRKFRKGVKVEYPDLTTRVALSEAEQDRGLPRALLMREGLLPYAETVVGSRRLCKAVRRATALSLTGSVAGTLLAFYLVFLGQYALLTPGAMLLYLLLWTLPVLLLGDWVGRY